MLKRWEVDLDGGFDITPVNWDGVVSFPGYSVCAIPSVDDYVQVVQNE
jgi:hypothetical protein